MIEPALGHARFVAIYFASLLTGSLGVMILDPETATLGASGAVYGLLGAAIVMARNRNIDLIQSGLLPILAFNLELHVLRERHLARRAHRRPDRRPGRDFRRRGARAAPSQVARRSRSAFCAVLGDRRRGGIGRARLLERSDAAGRFRDAVRVQRVAEPLEAVDEARAGAGEPRGGVGDDDPLRAERGELGRRSWRASSRPRSTS